MTEPAAPRPLTVVSGDVVLRGHEQGPPDAQPVVLLHGGGQTRHSWSHAAERLAGAGYRAVSMDLRGHGDSDWSPVGDYRVRSFADDLERTADRLGAPPVVVGASMGGMTAIVAEGEATGELSRALVIVDIAPRMEPEGVDRIVGFMTGYPDGFASLDEAADAIAAYRPHRPRPTDLSGLAKNLRQGPDGRWRWHWDPRFLSADAGPTSASDPDRLDRAARAIDVPTLLVRGRSSDLLSEEGARHFLTLVPHARYVDVGGAGHMVVGDRNDAFAAVTVAFVSEVCGGADSGEGAA